MAGEPLLCRMEALGSWEPKTLSPKRNQKPLGCQMPPHCQSLCGTSWGSGNPQNRPHQILNPSHVPCRGPGEGTREAPNPGPSCLWLLVGQEPEA